ncbi:MAG: ABC transporter substrate-binding protein [Bacteroidetes bacterium QS_7_67_15]|nr:MAG: ABC transporter substrate-binding protein [Bacteroidetes bacterium QS_7_67_15]
MRKCGIVLIARSNLNIVPSSRPAAAERSVEAGLVLRGVLLRGVLMGSVLLAGVLLGSCRNDPAGASQQQPKQQRSRRDTTVTDALGRRVELTLPARRAVSLAPNLTEIVVAAGAGGRLAGVTTADDFPPAAVDTLAQVQAYPQVDFEAVAALRPGLVLATDQVNAPRDAATLSSALGAPTYFFSFPSLASIFEAVETSGRLLGAPRRAQRAADSLRRVVRRVRQCTRRAIRRGDAERPLVLFLIGDDTLYTFSEGSYMHTLIRAAGGTSATADLATNAPLSEEFVLEKQPDVIVGAFGTDYDPARLARLHPTWKGTVPALENGRVYSVAASLFLRPGPRVAKGARQLARRLHPGVVGSSVCQKN